MAETLTIPTTTDRAAIYEAIYPQIAALIEDESDLTANLANIAAALKEAFGFFWVGFYITKEQLRKPVISIVDAIDGRQVFRECGLGLSKCSATHPCPIHDEYKISRDHLERLFTRKRIADLCEPVAKGSAYLLG